ncbi:MAG: gliding motility-associated C-terminal domain-containing protein [Bacteroidetes bacterium]|nr:gliding motility-associated C-terminal domain-containing protein [Bacteroidota bacterium]
MTTRLYILFICIAFGFQTFAQKGKDGAKVVSAANTKINEFTSLTADAAAGTNTITVAASSLNANARFSGNLAAGDLVMVIQMQGALMKLSPVPVWAPDSTYGNIYSYGSCGNYEFAEVKSVISSTQIELVCGLKYSYSAAGKVEVVRVPRYNSLTVNSGGVLTTDTWNGTIGGILSAEVDGNTVVNSGGTINANGLGFRGGVAVGNGGTGNGNFATKNPNDGAEKGEGIGSDRLNNALAIDTLGKQCKGAPANGGGGGNANNCGGGGGANAGNISGWNGYGICNTAYATAFNLEWPGRASVVSSGGGKGGYGTSTTTSVSPNTIGPNMAQWGSYKRPNYGGFGGHPMDYSSGKIFMGGGGGSGHMTSGQSNGSGACSGGNGGGIIYLLNYGTVSGTGTITANGNNGGNAFGSFNISNPTQGIDGAGGAGGGGTIVLESLGTVSAITALANGGNGGNQVITGATTSEGQGPGGGGGGGYIASNGSAFTQSVNGGTNGTTNATAFSSAFPPNGASSGDVGLKNQIKTTTVYSLTTSASQTLCTGQSTTLTAASTNTAATIDWYNTATGGAIIASGNTYTTPTYTAAGTYTVYAGSCPGTFRLPIVITVGTGASISINSPTICAGQTTTLTATGITTFTWSPGGANTGSISVTPASTTVYTVSGSAGSCTGTKTTTVTVLPQPTVAVASSTICIGSTTTLTATGAANYTWAPGGQTTATVAVSPTVTTTYTITGANGTCTNSTTATVNVVTTPTVTASSATICPGQTTTLTASGATNYTWSPGGSTGSTFTVSPASSANYTVLGATGTCTAQANGSVTVAPGVTLTVNSPTLCAGQTTTLTASGATAYTWTPGGQTTSSVVITPGASANYTVTGSNGTCSSVKVSTVTVNALPSLTVTNASICSGNTATLTASGATNYTWSPGGQTTASVSLSPTVSTNYTVTGATGSCSSTATTTVTVTTTPTVSVASVTICPGQTATLTASGATNYTWSPGGVAGSTYTTAPASNSTYTVTGANGSCTTQATASVTVGSSISITVNSPTICAGQSATLTASGATTYTWLPMGTNASTVAVNPGVTTTYTVNGTNGSCTGSGTSTVTISTPPTLTVTSASVCSGSSATLNVSGATNYTWTPGGQTTASVVVTPATTTNYTVTGATAFCSNTVTTSVTVTQTPTVSVASVTICPGGTGTLTASGATSYTWSPGSSTGTTYTANPGSTSTYTVLGANGTCTALATASMVVGSGISITVNSPTVCAGQTATLTASGATTYTWAPMGTAASSVAVTPASTSIYTVTGTVGTCTGSSTSTVTISSPPTLTVTSAAICSGDNATLTVSGATNYTWSPGGQTTNTISVSPATTSVYTVTGATAFCTGVSTTTVSVTQTPTVSVASATICAGGTGTLTASGATAYTWTPGSIAGATYTDSPAASSTYTVLGANGTCTAQATGNISVVSALVLSVNSATICTGQSATLTVSGASGYTWTPGGATTSSIAVSPASTSVYSVTGSSGSCAASATTQVLVNAVPVLTVNPAAICIGQTATLTASGATTYTWSTGANTNTVSVTPPSTTVYTVTGQSNGCTAVMNPTVTVTPLPSLTLTASATSVCAGQSATLTATGATNYQWLPGGQNTSVITVTPASTTSYSVTGDNGGCQVTNTIQVMVVTPASVSLTSDVNSGCSTLCANFTVSNSSAFSVINIHYGDGATGAALNHCYPTAGTYSAYAVCTGTNGCTSTDTLNIPITVFANPTASFNMPGGDVVTIGSSIQVNNTSANAATYAWQFCSGTSTQTNPLITPADTGNCCIQLVALSGAGCTDTVVKCVRVINEATILIPNVFTPNSDNVNDFFKITSNGIKTLHCAIYDRWGLKMYEWDGINGYWDGKTKSGASVPSGTYFYLVDYTDIKDTTKTEKGYLSLLKD